jgi:hypothetical protein
MQVWDSFYVKHTVVAGQPPMHTAPLNATRGSGQLNVQPMGPKTRGDGDKREIAGRQHFMGFATFDHACKKDDNKTTTQQHNQGQQCPNHPPTTYTRFPLTGPSPFQTMNQTEHHPRHQTGMSWDKLPPVLLDLSKIGSPCGFVHSFPKTRRFLSRVFPLRASRDFRGIGQLKTLRRFGVLLVRLACLLAAEGQVAPIVVGGAVEVLGVPFRAGGAWWGGARMVFRELSGRCQEGVRKVSGIYSGRYSGNTVTQVVAPIQFVQAVDLLPWWSNCCATFG